MKKEVTHECDLKAFKWCWWWCNCFTHEQLSHYSNKHTHTLHWHLGAMYKAPTINIYIYIYRQTGRQTGRHTECQLSEGAGKIHSSNGRSCSQNNHSPGMPESWTLWKSGEKKYVIEKRHQKKWNPVRSMSETQQTCGQCSLVWRDQNFWNFSGLCTKCCVWWNTLRIPSVQWSMVVVEACCEDICH